MAAGTAVLTSDRGALAEVAGQAALLVDPEDVDAIANGFRRLVFDEALRQYYERAGPLQVSKFSQAGFAKRIEALYAALAC
jgi:glycosyltransferase involved in cell wall biosynthesis